MPEQRINIQNNNQSMTPLEFQIYQQNVILPYLKERLSKEDKLAMMEKFGLWNSQSQLVEINTREKWISNLGFDKCHIEYWQNPNDSSDREKMLNALIGMNSDMIQKAIETQYENEENGQKLYTQINSDTLGTPFAHMENIFKLSELKDGETVIDLGSGFGNVGIYLGLKRPMNSFIGHEIIRERHDEAERVKEYYELNSICFQNSDICQLDEANLIAGDQFVLYDPLSLPMLNELLGKMKNIARNKSFKIIAIDGQSDFIEVLANCDFLIPKTYFKIDQPLRRIFVFESV